jgi:peroxiredoxin
MEQVAQEYQSRGISVVGINANAKESADDVKTHASANHLSFTILKDHQNKIADYLGAQVTPEAFLLDPSNKLLYHGRVDNSRDLTKVKTRDLRDALDAFLAGKQIEKPTALAFGCTIQRVK